MSSFDEIRRYHLAITCHTYEHHYGSRFFALYYRSNCIRVTGNNSSVLAACNFVHNKLFFIQKNANMSSLVSELTERLWASFNSDSSWEASEEVVASRHVIFHPKALIDCTADGSMANITCFDQFWHRLSWVLVYRSFQSCLKFFGSHAVFSRAVRLRSILPSASNLPTNQ